MKFFSFIMIIGILCSGCTKHIQSKERFLNETLIPLAQGFLQRNKLPSDANIRAKDIDTYSVEFFKKKPGCTASLSLTNGYYFSYIWDGSNAEVSLFHDKTKTTFNLANASPQEIKAVKALSLRNKINDISALELARHYFKLQGHREEDFLPVEFGPYTWGQINEPDYIQYPFYLAQWYRKDVNLKDRENGEVILPNVAIEISGISSNMVGYSKCFMPIGRDF
jgi:hypothetical protein